MNTAAPTKKAKSQPKQPVLRLIESWRRETAYDSQAWPRVRRALTKNRLSRRPALND